MAWKIYPNDSSDEKKEFGKKIYAMDEFNFRHNCYAYMTELIFWQHTDKWRRTRTQSDLSVFFFGFFLYLHARHLIQHHRCLCFVAMYQFHPFY